MLSDRNYTVTTGEGFESLRISLSDFEKLYVRISDLNIKNIVDREGLPVSVRFFDPSTDFSSTKAVSVFAQQLFPGSSGELKEFQTTMQSQRVIVVYMGYPGKDGYLAPLALEKKIPKTVEMFPVQRLSFCLLDARIMPHSIKLITDAAKKKEILDHFGSTKLNIFAQNDPVVKYFAANVGDVFEIIRSPEGGTPSISWRKVAATIAPTFNKK